MAETMATVGRFVAFAERPYDFVDRNGERVAGTSRALWIMGSDDEPVRVKVPGNYEGDVEDLRVLEFGEEVRVVYGLWANGGKIERRLQSVSVAS